MVSCGGRIDDTVMVRRRRSGRGLGPGRRHRQRRTPLKVKGTSETADIKQEIQDTAWAIVKLRDGGCILRGKFGHVCSGWRKDGGLIYQADHLIERSNSATYADTRLIVCVCKGYTDGSISRKAITISTMRGYDKCSRWKLSNYWTAASEIAGDPFARMPMIGNLRSRH